MEKTYECKTYKKCALAFHQQPFVITAKNLNYLIWEIFMKGKDYQNLKKKVIRNGNTVFKDWRKIEEYQLCDNISDINVSDYSQDHIYIGTTPVKQRKPSLTQ